MSWCLGTNQLVVAAVLLLAPFQVVALAQSHHVGGYGGGGARGSPFNPSTNHLVYYADQCAGMKNDGVHDDALPLRTCMAAMPTGATITLDGAKPYYFITGSKTGPVWGSDVSCGLIVKAYQTLDMRGAKVTDSNAFESSGGYIICAGSPNFNFPGSSGGSPTYDNIAATAPNATRVILAPHARAASYHPGDDLYIDGGTATNHICVGWDQVSDVNATTGVINLKYPLIKPYPGTSSQCAGGTPRIYDWTTCGDSNGNCGSYNLGPLASEVTIENGTITRHGSERQGPILLEGAVHPVLRNLVLRNITNGGSGAIFGNNNHLGIFDNVKVDGYGCTVDATLQSGAFTSSRNLIENSIVSSSGNPGVGCGSSEHEVAFADEEGNEANYYKNDTATLLPGNPSNLASLVTCAFSNVSWGIVYDGLKCRATNGSGFQDQGGTGITGPTTVENSDISTVAGNAILTNVLNDKVANNKITVFKYGIGLYAQAGSITATANTVLDYMAVYAGSYGIKLGTDPALASSTISNNTLVCLASDGRCSNGIVVPTPGGGSSAHKLTISENQVSASFSPRLSWPGLRALPNVVIVGNSGIPDVNSQGSGTYGRVVRSLPRRTTQ